MKKKSRDFYRKINHEQKLNLYWSMSETNICKNKLTTQKITKKHKMQGYREEV
jgi:hypothetical protein